MVLPCPMMIALRKGYNMVTQLKDKRIKCFEATGCCSTECKVRSQHLLKQGTILGGEDITRRLSLVIAVDDVFRVLAENNLLDKIEKSHIDTLINEAKECLDAVNTFNQEKDVSLSTIINIANKKCIPDTKLRSIV